MYHINLEGKVYPCKARINKCPYGDNRHAESKEELFYRVMKLSKDANPTHEAKREISITGRLRSLWSSSKDIAIHKSPIEVITATLDYAINTIEEANPSDYESKWESIINRGGEAVYEALKYGLLIPKIVPQDIKDKGNRLFYERLKGRPVDYAGSTRNQRGLDKRKYIMDMEQDFENYKEWKKWKLTNENKEATLRWLKYDFYQFSHDLNTSKMITQPVFYGDLDKARNTIKNMDDYELLSSYDDYLLSEKEVLENVRLANDFVYTNRNDLSAQANNRIKTWYNMNRTIVEDWKKNAPKRVLLSVEMANELDRRGIIRQDNALGRIKE